MYEAGKLYDRLKTLYSLDVPEKLMVNFAGPMNDSDQKELMQKFSENRNRQLNELSNAFKRMEEKGSFDDIAKGKLLSV